MVAKLVIDGKTFDIEILDPKLQEIIAPKKTGYELADKDAYYYWDDTIGVSMTDVGYECDKEMYDAANYYSSQDIAKNNSRADKLMRHLRRFAVEHRENKLDWSNYGQAKYIITYKHETKKFFPEDIYENQDFGTIYFDSAESACKAIDTFKDELVWYFTEYKDSL